MNIDYHDIGGRIRTARVGKNVSQEKLAEMVGVGTTHISHIETGNTKLSIKVFVDILNSLNISADELLRNHLHKAKHVLDGEMAALLQDCSDEETRVITDTVTALKASLRFRSKD